ncbi:hypothetical protein J4210_03670 [Candidatus Woesearchaeota archaeon]|nr:hypothetical protein [Candidatus Woesearchaeota archaeon]
MTDYEEKYDQARAFLQEWLDQQGHDRCWYYPDLFRKLVGIYEIVPALEPELPPLEEFKKGCERYQREEYEQS